METHGRSNLTAKEAAEALAAAEDSRRRARRADYPAWFWWVTGLAMAAIAAGILVPIPNWSTSLLTLAVVTTCCVTAWVMTRVRRLRGPCATVWWGLWPVVPAVAFLVIAVVLHAIGWWADPIGGLVASGLVGASWVATGLTVTRRPGALG